MTDEMCDNLLSTAYNNRKSRYPMSTDKCLFKASSGGISSSKNILQKRSEMQLRAVHYIQQNVLQSLKDSSKSSSVEYPLLRPPMANGFKLSVNDISVSVR